MKVICKQYRTKLVLFGLLQINCKESFLVSTYRLALAGSFCLFLLWFCSAPYAIAQESPYFVAYDHNLEEPGNLEIEYFSTFGTQRAGNDFHSFWTEFEYGVNAWWTTEFYLDAQTSFNDSSVYSGFKWENRFRVLKHEHWINPVLYAEFEDINGADKTLKEIVGHDGQSDFLVPNKTARMEHKREVELKLILSSNTHGWNFSENII